MIIEKLPSGHYKVIFKTHVGYGETLREAVRNIRSLIMVFSVSKDPQQEWRESRWQQNRLTQKPTDLS